MYGVRDDDRLLRFGTVAPDESRLKQCWRARGKTSSGMVPLRITGNVIARRRNRHERAFVQFTYAMLDRRMNTRLGSRVVACDEAASDATGGVQNDVPWVRAIKRERKLMNTYAENFDRALERTEKWGLRSMSSFWMQQLLLHDLTGITLPTDEGARNLSRQLPVEPFDRIGDCAVVSARMLEFLFITNAPQVPVLTIGDVRVGGTPRYQVTQKTLERMLRKGRSAGTMHMHVWLTWPDLRVMDLVLPSVLAFEANHPLDLSREDALVYYGAGDGGAFEYHPWLVGRAKET